MKQGGSTVKLILIGLLLIGVAAPLARAQDVDIEGSVQGDGFARAGHCVVTPEAIYVVNTDDTQARVHIKCHNANNSRIIHVYQVEIMGDGSRRRFQDTQFDFGGPKSPDKDFLTAINTSCGAGSGTYSLDVSAETQGKNNLDVELWTTNVTLPVSNCS